MLTKVQKPKKNVLLEAAKLLKKGNLVAFPTETVYGLGADAFNSAAVKNIFRVKGRPSDNPLIVHVGYKKDLSHVVKSIPSKAKKLIRSFWPGPLTLVLQKKKKVPAIVSAGLSTVAVRMPKHKIALKLIRKSVPLAAPSANLAGKPSPTRAQHVFDDLKNKIPLILDGGTTHIGIESTVLDLTSNLPALLRPGKITIEQIEKVIGLISISNNKKGVVKSPGMKYKHYAPKAKVIVVKGKQKNVKNKVKSLQKKYKNVAVLQKNSHVKTAYRLFNFFRECDKKGIKIILVEGMAEQGLGHALANRIEKAASKIIRV